MSTQILKVVITLWLQAVKKALQAGELQVQFMSSMSSEAAQHSGSAAARGKEAEGKPRWTEAQCHLFHPSGTVLPAPKPSSLRHCTYSFKMETSLPVY